MYWYMFPLRYLFYLADSPTWNKFSTGLKWKKCIAMYWTRLMLKFRLLLPSRLLKEQQAFMFNGLGSWGGTDASSKQTHTQNENTSHKSLSSPCRLITYFNIGFWIVRKHGVLWKKTQWDGDADGVKHRWGTTLAKVQLHIFRFKEAEWACATTFDDQIHTAFGFTPRLGAVFRFLVWREYQAIVQRRRTISRCVGPVCRRPCMLKTSW